MRYISATCSASVAAKFLGKPLFLNCVADVADVADTGREIATNSINPRNE